MQPVFNEFIEFLENKSGMSLNLPDKSCWVDNHIIKMFDSDGGLHNVCKYKVDEDLNVSVKIYPQIKTFVPETWDETVRRMKSYLNSIENDSLKIVKKAIDTYPNYEFFCLTSTGKDSSVVIDLVKRVKPDIKIVFNNTSLDCAGTYKMAKSHKDWIITNPEEGFYQWIKRTNFIPTRFARVCCRIFKEGNHISYFKDTTKRAVWFMGIRNDESTARADKKDFIRNPKWGELDWYGCLPIRKWSEFDVWLYTLARNLEINPKYKEGYSRVGCAIACPYASKYTWVLDEYFYPTMRDRWLRILNEDFIKGERWTRFNCTQMEYHKCWGGGLYREEPTEEVVDEFMQHKGLEDRNIAMQYFNKVCCECGKNVRQGDVLAMNLKFFATDTSRIYCKKHLMKRLNIDIEKYDEYVKDFKEQGCKLF